MALAGKLREERRLRGWTLDDLAERAGLSKSLLSKIERDQVSPSLRTLKALANGLELPLAWLLRRTISSSTSSARTAGSSSSCRVRRSGARSSRPPSFGN